MNNFDNNYQNILKTIIERGEKVPNRTGIDTISVLGMQHHYDLSEGFPVLTTKKVLWEKAIAETLWFLSGECHNIAGLVQENREGKTIDARNIWDKWADEDGNLGRVYGTQWRSWKGADGKEVDQFDNAVWLIRNDPSSRRNIVTAWNPSELEDMALPPCHLQYQFTARNGKLHLHMHQRSCDVPIGVPFNIVGYAAILAMVAKLTGLERGQFIHTMHDAHIYENQIPGVWKMLDNVTGGGQREAPELRIHGDQKKIEDFKLSDFELVGYDPHPFVKIPVAV